jgi:uncharacterized protein YbjT (DUF2867 family)
MTYLITGATGEVGSRVVRQLLERHIRHFLTIFPQGRFERSLGGRRFRVCDVSSRGVG